MVNKSVADYDEALAAAKYKPFQAITWVFVNFYLLSTFLILIALPFLQLNNKFYECSVDNVWQPCDRVEACSEGMRYRAIATDDPEFMVNWHVEMKLTCENRYKIGAVGAVYFFAAALSILSFYDLQRRFGRVLIMGYSLAASLVCQVFLLTMSENLDTLLILMSFIGFTFVGKVSALMYLMEVTPSNGRKAIIISVLTTQIGLTLLFIALTSWHIEYSWKM